MAQFLDELEYFTNKKGISLQSPANEGEILAAEKILNCSFSPQMISFLRQYDGGFIIDISIDGVQYAEGRELPEGLDLIKTNQSLRTCPGWNPNWLEIGQDGFGNYFVADMTRKLGNGEYPILFVDHEAIGADDCSSEYSTGYFEFILKSVAEMKEIYTQSGELYDLLTDQT